jgi:hypothetical protein
VTFVGIAGVEAEGDSDVVPSVVVAVEQAAAPKATTAEIVNARMVFMRFLPYFRRGNETRLPTPVQTGSGSRVCG